MVEIMVTPILAGIDDLIGLFVVVVFVGISLIGNVIKAASEKKEKDSSAGGKTEVQPDLSQKTPPQSRPSGLAHRLPYAKAVPAGIGAKPKSTLEKLEELKQRRLEQIRQQQQQRPIKQPDVQRKPSFVQPVQPKPIRPSLFKPIQKPVIKPVPIPVAQPVKSSEMPVQKPAVKMQKGSVAEPSFSRIHRNLITMLRDKKMIRNAIVASEILGNPISLR